jgi:putative DNA methylase
MTYRKKLIEVALPLEAINIESAREKSIRHGHPSTLHLWWARRPLAACRAVLFASLVDDPSSHPDKFPTEEAQIAERQRLFDILGRITIATDKKGNTKQVVRGLVSWDDINNPDSGVLIAAQKEIARSIAWNRGDEPPTEPEAVRQYLAENAPPVYDPFAGGGSIPLEAQRLGLEAHASDLNPVAVLINKALIEIPPKFRDMPPVNPEAQQKLKVGQWKGAQGLAEDVRYYGKWMRDEAEKRIGHLYPKVKLPPEKGGGETTVIAWLWARTVRCPNPICGCQMPLVRSFALATKKGKESYLEPIIDYSKQPSLINFKVRAGGGEVPEPPKTGRGARFFCLACKQVVADEHIKSEGKAGRMSAQLMAVVAQGKNNRVYLEASEQDLAIAKEADPRWYPDASIGDDRRSMFTPLYGLTHFHQLFTPRQLVALTSFCELLQDVRGKVISDMKALGKIDDSLTGEGVSVNAYANSISVYLAFAIDRLANYSSTICTWHSGAKYETLTSTFGRQALPMTWDFAEGNPFSNSSGNITSQVEGVATNLENLPLKSLQGKALQRDAASLSLKDNVVFSTDPPYYDNIGYADLSDFFYIWLRCSLNNIYTELFNTLLVPKSQELVATPYRFNGDKQKAESFFEEGLGNSFKRMRESHNSDYPLTVFYAFKQVESDIDDKDSESANALASTGWETMLEGLLRSGFTVTGTLPMRTELTGNLKKNVGALASSIVLVCRPRPADAPSTTRRRFVDELKSDLPDALKKLQQGNIAPVDLAQASIGPGMAIYSRYAKVLESDGSPMKVRTALQLINQTLDEFLTEQEGEFDTDTRWALAWFEQYLFNEGQFGDAETLSKAKNTSIKGMVEAGILTAKAGKVQLIPRDALPIDWNPAKDSRIPVWEATQHLIWALDQTGETGAAHLLSQLGNLGEVARDLAYRLYSICDRKGWTQEAIAYNSLVISWSEISRLALEEKQPSSQQLDLI